jgi:hypothetical protein
LGEYGGAPRQEPHDAHHAAFPSFGKITDESARIDTGQFYVINDRSEISMRLRYGIALRIATACAITVERLNDSATDS